MAFTGDGNVLVTGCGDANIRAFDVETGERLLLLSGHTNGSVADYSFTRRQNVGELRHG